MVKPSESGQHDLEPNHTHFLLFDGGSTSADSVLVHRAEIEKQSRRIKGTALKGDTLTPIVIVLVEGGPLSIRTVCRALESNTPLVVLQVRSRTDTRTTSICIIDRSRDERRISSLISTRTSAPWIRTIMAVFQWLTPMTLNSMLCKNISSDQQLHRLPHSDWTRIEFTSAHGSTT